MLVLHYRIFCAGIKVETLTEELKNNYIHFRKIAEAKWNVFILF